MSNKALALYEKFNNKPAKGFVTKSISITPNLVDLGPCIAVAYKSSKEGSSHHYEHKFRGARLYCSEDGKTLIISGANIKVTDWIRG